MSEICQVTGVVYLYEGENTPAANVPVTVRRVLLAGQLYSTFSCTRYTDSNGNISLSLPQGSTAYIFAPVEEFEVEGGVALAIPEDDTARLEDLVSVETVPPEGLTIQDAGVPFSQLVGTLNFTGAGKTVSVAGGVMTLHVPGGSASVFEALGDMSYASVDADVERLPGNTQAVRKLLAQLGTGTESAAPEWYVLTAADIPALAISGITGLQAALDGKQASLGYTAENQANKATDFLTVNHTLYPTVAAAKAYADSLVVGLLDDRGNYDASGNVFPSSGGSGTAGAVLKGDLWVISVAGTLGGAAVAVGDQIRALVDSPGQTAGNWAISEANIGYVTENQANKATGFGTLNNTLYPTTLAVSNYAQPLSVHLTEVANIGSSLQQIRVNAGGTALEYFTPTGTAWGSITGTLSNQTDLAAALALKAPLASPTFTGQVLIPAGTAANSPGLAFTGNTDSGLHFANGAIAFGVDGGYRMAVTAAIMRLNNTHQMSWSSDPVNSNSNTGIARDSDAVVKITDGGSGGGALKTADPTSGMGPAWKWGSKKAAAVTLDTANYVEVSIGGVTVKLAIVN